MAKKNVQPNPNTTRFSIQGFDMAHYQTTDRYVQLVDELFNRAIQAITKAASKGKYDPDKPFSFDDYPDVKKVLQDEIKRLASCMITTIETGSKQEWLFACKKNDGFIGSIMDTSKLSKDRLAQFQDLNLEALKTFQGRKVKGLDLSQRVWNYVDQFKEQLEDALDVGIADGRSAQALARDVKQYLREPDRLFRRVRDKRGNLQLSKAAAAYHPGRGVYRSSVKNAQRLTRSEINMAYRESDYLRWQQLDFVVGFEIHRSNHRPLCKCKVCEKLVGRYPKNFKFVGWHPQCMCYATPILMDEETFDENELGDLKAALRGTEYKHKQAKNVVTDVPDGLKEWIADNAPKQKNWASVPYFVRDNFVNGSLSDGLKQSIFELTLQVEEAVKAKVQAFIPVISMKEAVERAKSYGVRDIDFGDVTVDEANIVLEVLHQASGEIGIDINRMFIAKDLNKLSGHGTKQHLGGFYDSDRNILAIDLSTFRDSQYKPLKSYAEKIESLRNNISSLEKQIAQSESRLGRSKSMDRMLKSDIKALRSRILDIELKIKEYEKLIANGNDALPLTYAASFPEIKDQIKASIWHELGHYVDNRLKRPKFKEGNFMSEYCKDMRGEEFAEWFAYYKMHGEDGVPADLLKIFKNANGIKANMSVVGCSIKETNTITRVEQNYIISKVQQINRKIGIFEGLEDIAFVSDAENNNLFSWSNGRLTVSTNRYVLDNGKEFAPGKELFNALKKLSLKQPLSFDEEYAIEALFHESVHSRAGDIYSKITKGNIDEVVFEACTQLYARDRYVKILKHFGVEPKHFDTIARNGYGYRREVDMLRPYFTKDGKLQVGELINIANLHENGLKALNKKLKQAGLSETEIKNFRKRLLRGY